MTTDWEFGARKDRCGSCGSPFVPDGRYVSCLSPAEGGLARADFCAACWDRAPPGDTCSFWRGRVSASSVRPRLVDTGTMARIFRGLPEEGDAQAAAFRFILGLMLVRRRYFRLERLARSGDRDLIVLGRSRTKETFRVADLALSREEIAEMTRRVAGLLVEVSGEAPACE